MTTDVAVRDDTAPLALRPGQLLFDDKQQAALTAMGVKNATKADMAVFAHVCHRTQLDPFTRQIYMIERREMVAGKWVSKQTIQVGIDGFRVVRDRVAERTGCEVEFEDTIWYDAEGREHKVWLSAEPPAACRVVLLKHSVATGRTLRYPAVLRTAAYIARKDGKPTGQWRDDKQPDHMIEKCCEAFATRRAFPNDFSGVYLEEEMQGRAAGGDDRPAVRKVTAADIMQPAEPDGEPAEGEIVDDAPPARTVTPQEVNDHFKRLGFSVKDKPQVLHAAGVLAGLGKAPAALAGLTPDQLAIVAESLESCGERGDLVAMLAEVSGPGDDDAAQAAAERAFAAGESGE